MLAVFLPVYLQAGGIVNNSTVSVTGEDSISFTFYNLDSLGQNIGGLDTTFILVRNGAGDSIFSEIVAGVTGRVKRHVVSSDTAYSWTALVADIDGAGTPGVYSVAITAFSDATSGWLKSPRADFFQLVDWELDNMGDSCGLAATAAAAAVDSLKKVLDSVYAVLDTLQAGFGSQALHDVNMAQLSGDAQAANSLESMLDGTGGGSMILSKLKIISVDTGLVIKGLGGAPGVYIEGGSSGNAVEFHGGSVTGDGLKIAANEGDGIDVTGNGAGHYDIKGDIHGAIDTVLKPPDSMAVYFNDKTILASLTADSVLADSLSYRGSGGGSDSSSIARWVWNTPQANHGFDGTFGKYLDAEISGLGTGSGIYAYSLLTYDTLINQVIPGVNLTVRNSGQTALVAVARTGSDGLITFSLDDDSFMVMASAPGYIFESGKIIFVSGAGTDTLFGYRFDPGTPASPELCRVYGHLYDIKGQPVADAMVSASLPQGVTQSGGIVVSPLIITVTTDSSGYFFLDLIPSDSLLPDDTSYEFTIYNEEGTIFRRRLKIPASSSWQLEW